MKKGRSYKVRLPKGGWKTLECVDVIHAGVAMSPVQVKDYYGIGAEKKRTLKGYMRPLRRTTRYVFRIPLALTKSCGIRGVRYMVLTDSFKPEIKKL